MSSSPEVIPLPPVPGHGTSFVAVMASLLWVAVAFSLRGTAAAVPAMLAATVSLALSLWLCRERRRLGRELASAQQAGATLATHAALVDVALASDVDEVLARSAALLGATRAWLCGEPASGGVQHVWSRSGLEAADTTPWWQDVFGDDDIWLGSDNAPARCAALLRQGDVKLGVLCFEAERTRKAWGAREAGLLWALSALVRQVLLRQSLEQALAQASEEHARERRAFLAHLSHKLRTPMTAVLGFAQILALEEGLSAQQYEFVREVETAGQALLAMLNELVGIGRE